MSVVGGTARLDLWPVGFPGKCCSCSTARGFDHAGNSGQRIANLVRQPGSQFAESCQVLGARHLGTMQALDFFPALAQLRHHAVEVAPQVANLVVTPGKDTN